MTEEEWLTAVDPTPMLAYLRGKVSDRKRYLFACACWRRVLAAWPHARARAAVEMGEKYADGQATEADLAAILVDQSEPGAWPVERALDVELLVWAARAVATLRGSGRSAVPVSWAPVQLLTRLFGWITAPFTAEVAERVAQADLLRHIIGNPFRPLLAPDHWPAAVRSLAEALYAGEDYGFALHDALLDAGHTELADHFRAPTHPRGCWALDLILKR